MSRALKPKPGEPRLERLSPDDLEWMELMMRLVAKQEWMDSGPRSRDAKLTSRMC